MGGRRAIVWTDEARWALADALEYVAQDSVKAAIRVLEESERIADSLTEMSNRGRVVPEWNREDLREVYVFDYRLIYEVTEDTVRVIAFLHGARDFRRWEESQ